jgi:dCTP deaminase
MSNGIIGQGVLTGREIGQGILTGHEIKKQYEIGNIIIHPKNRDPGPNSYDVAIGNSFWRQAPNDSGKDIYFFSDEHDIRRNWQYCEAEKWENIVNELTTNNILDQESSECIYDVYDPNDKIILLNPGELILAHTEEFIGSVGNVPITTEMKARSSAGRSGISVCKCAGMGDPGYCTRWTMEVKNEGNKIIPIKVGTRIAQIVFITTVGQVESYTNTGHYFNIKEKEVLTGENIAETMAKTRKDFIDCMVLNWSATQMLPNAKAFN